MLKGTLGNQESIHTDLDHSSQICRNKPEKGLSKPLQSHAEEWRIFKAIHMNQFISGLCWAYLTWATVLNHSAGWVEMCPDGAAGWGFIIAAAFQGGLLAPAHKPPTDHFIWLYVYAYVYICAYRLQQAFGKRYLMNIYHIFKWQFWKSYGWNNGFWLYLWSQVWV